MGDGSEGGMCFPGFSFIGSKTEEIFLIKNCLIWDIDGSEGLIFHNPSSSPPCSYRVFFPAATLSLVLLQLLIVMMRYLNWKKYS